MKLTAANSTFAIGGVSCSAENFVVTGCSVLRMNICAENPAHRKSAKRYMPFLRFVATASELQTDYKKLPLTN